MPLRRDVIKLASEYPELRKHLMPILRRTAGYVPRGARWRVNYNGQQVSRVFRSVKESFREWERSGMAYRVCWLEFDDPETGDWFPLPFREFKKIQRRLERSR